MIMFTDSKNFYPTPTHMVLKMIKNIDFRKIQSILEPSAGSGNIVDELKNKEKMYSSSYNKYTFDIDCIEINQNLQRILKGKNYKVVHDDFLTYNTMKEYDLIIMNPPFDNGAKHFLKAIEMQKRNGGEIVCLLNAETIKNQYSNDRQQIGRLLEEYNANIEYIQDSFLDAERKTGVEIALITVKMPAVERPSFIYENLRKAQEEKEIKQEEQYYLAENDYFQAIVNQYKLEVSAGINFIKEYYAMSPLIMREFKTNTETKEIEQSGGSILSLSLSSNNDRYRNNISVNEYIKEVRKKYWSALFQNKEFVGKLTNNLQSEFYNKLDSLKEYDFSIFNVLQLRVDMMSKMVEGVEQTIIDLFDELTSRHSYNSEYSKNIHYYNGWKTNSAYKINPKVIIPLNGYDTFWGKYNPSHYQTVGKLEDIEKSLSYLDNGLTEIVDIEEALKFAEEYGETKNIVLKYFEVTFYKKGTCHIKFTNEELLAKFNIFGSQKKGWLPPSYGKKKYNEMDNEEKAVIDEFEGEKEYTKVMSNPDYYIFNGNNLKLLETQAV